VAVLGEVPSSDFSDNSAVLSCYLERSSFADGVPQMPPGEIGLLYAVQFERDKEFSIETSRHHDPNGLLQGARLERMGTMDSPHGKVLMLSGNGDDGIVSTISLVLGKEDERGYLASLSRNRPGEEPQADSLEQFYPGFCKLWRPESGANLLFEALQGSEPILKLGKK
ncbi:MAG: hypothetical protein AAFY42_14215, partial [Pseudomonadota bacterium]